YRLLDTLDHERAVDLDLLPRVGLVLPEICVAILIGLHLLCRRLACEQKHHSHQREHDSLHFHSSSVAEIPRQGCPREKASVTLSATQCDHVSASLKIRRTLHLAVIRARA